MLLQTSSYDALNFATAVFLTSNAFRKLDNPSHSTLFSALVSSLPCIVDVIHTAGFSMKLLSLPLAKGTTLRKTMKTLQLFVEEFPQRHKNRN